MNITNVLGNLCKNVEKKTSKNGVEFYTMSVADNQMGDAVIFWDIIMFNKISDKFLACLTKGSAVVVTGQVNPLRTYEKNDGTTGTAMSLTASAISFSPFKSKPEDGAAPAPAQQAAPQENMPF